MSPTYIARLLSVSAIVLAMGLGVVAQSAPSQSSSKLGAPAITAASSVPLPDPGSLFQFSSSVGKTLRFLIVGSTRGAVWGDGVYTSDSVLAVAAVHAGLLEPGEAGIVSVEVIEGPPTYEGAARHGVTSLDYGAWEFAYRLTNVEPVDGAAVLPDPGSLSTYRGQNGLVLKFQVVGSTDGSVWGDGIYTDDSVLAAAAVHAGILKPDEAGVVTVEIMPGQAEYGSSLAHGVESKDYGNWDGSYRILTPQDAKISSKLSN